jgi:CspA family cold shock protein
MTGTIKKLTDKGFGFITAESMGKDLFFHSNALVGVSFDELREGDSVSFETEESPKGNERCKRTARIIHTWIYFNKNTTIWWYFYICEIGSQIEY